MPNSRDDLPMLFRSLAPDDTGFQAAVNASARAAGERWPLLKAVSPKKPNSTPALSAQERQYWSNPAKSDVGQRKPALSLPGASDKMTRSLGRMSVRAVSHPPASDRNPKRANVSTTEISAVQVEPEKRPNVARSIQPTAITTTAAMKSSSTLFSGRSQTRADEAVDNTSGMPVNHNQPESRAAMEKAANATPVDASLASVFSRIEGKVTEVAKSASKPSSFLSRLGRR